MKGLYNSINTGIEKNAKSTVTLEILEKLENTELYRTIQITKSEIFELNNSKKMFSYFEQEIVRYKSNGEKELPIKSVEQYKSVVEKLIPQKILNGILFDGERMRSLSTNEKSSIDTIESIISDITNRSLLDKTNRILNDLRKDYTKERSKLLKKSGQNNQVLAEQREAIQNSEIDLLELISNSKEELYKLNFKNNEIEEQLLFYEESRSKINKKRELQFKLKTLIELREQHLDDFSSKIRLGFLVPSKNLFNCVRSEMDNYDVPKGLNVDAVNSILEREFCICGEPLDDKHRKHLQDIVVDLPPDNLNATIGEMLKQNETRRNRFINEFEVGFQNYISNDSTIIKLENELIEIQDDIGDTDDAEIKSLDKENRIIGNRIAQIQADLNYHEKSLNEVKQDLKIIDEEINIKNEADVDLSKLNKAIRKIEKYINLTEGIIEHNKSMALNEINELINSGFSKISEDYQRGRRVYITQFFEPRYKLVPYIVSEFDRIRLNMNKQTLASKYKTLDLNIENQLKEAMILESSTSSSTGQAKINALSFVYSIMQYTLKDRGKDIIHRNKQYPLLIDAPLSEISGESLNMISKNLSSFNNQVIVMIDDNTYDMSKENLTNVGKIYRLDKTHENLSTKVVIER